MTNPTFILPSSPGIAANNLYALKVGNQPERFSPISGTFARSTTATRQNANGLIESIAINTPRLDYTYGSCPAVLLEPQRTNLSLQSNDFGSTQWTKASLTATSNNTTAPNGNTEGTLISIGVDASSTRHRILPTVANSYTLGTTYTWSVYAKKGSQNWIQLLFQTTAFDINSWANFDLNNGVVGTIGSSTTARIQSVGNGWYRCSITATATITATSIAEVVSTNNTNSIRYPSFQSTTAEDIYYLWGGQLEVGSFPTTLIPTTSAAVTRTADTFSYSNIYTNGYVSSQGGTWLIELKNNVSYVRDGATAFAIGDTTSLNNNSIVFLPSTTSRQVLRKYVAGLSSVLYTTTTDNVKIAIKWNGTTADVFVNGVKQVSATVFTATALEFMGFTTSSGLGIPTFIQSMALFNTPLSDAECVLLTSDTYGSFATLASSTSYTLS